ncbi:MAG: hypothetical protein NT133_18455 [Alphaproteobacteria bacterium]|nr:hypothetical protein [Alphaproteobacteria bacterium]
MRPRILLISMADWFGPTRLPRALRMSGFEVGILADPNGLLATSRHIDYRYDLSPDLVRLGVLDPVLRTIMEFSPRLLVPCDETAVHLLQNIAMAWDGARGPGGQLRVMIPPMVREIVLRSLGEARTFAVRTSRPLARKMAGLLGIPAPPSAPVPYLQAAEGFARDHGWPVVLTRNGRTGGDQVRVCADSAQLYAGYAALTQEPPQPGGLRRAARYAFWSLRTGFHLAGDIARPLGDGPQMAIEAVIQGRPASYSVASHDGRWLAGIAAIAERIHPPGSGTSSAVRLLNDPAMTDAGQKLVGRLGFTGFGGLDFMRDDATGQLWFLRFNARPTPLVHLGHLAGGDLCAALYGAVTNAPSRAPKQFAESTVALFPQDWQRDPDAADRGTTHVDLPEEDDRLLAALKAQLPRAG